MIYSFVLILDVSAKLTEFGLFPLLSDEEEDDEEDYCGGGITELDGM